MKKDAANAASGIENEHELTAEELERVIGGVIPEELRDRNGKALGIEEADNVTMSFVKGGITFTTTVVASNLTFSKLVGKSFYCGTDTVTGASVDFTKTKE